MKIKATALVLLLALAACGGDLKAVAKNLLLIAETNATLQSTVIDFHNAGAIPKDQADAVVRVTEAVALAGAKAATLTEDFARMPEANRDELLEILEPAVLAVASALGDPEILAITHEPTKTLVRSSLLTLASLLNAVRLFLTIGG